ncbi:MAG: hypothetical protein ACRD1E_09560, partial [Terriglobales bacterium]
MPRLSLRRIPSVDALLRRATLAPLWLQLGPAATRAVIAGELDRLRASPTAAEFASSLAQLEPRLQAAARARLAPSLRPLINATGVLLHTNLGRAPLAPAAVARLAQVAGDYTNLELDLGTGRRARRDR